MSRYLRFPSPLLRSIRLAVLWVGALGLLQVPVGAQDPADQVPLRLSVHLLTGRSLASLGATPVPDTGYLCLVPNGHSAVIRAEMLEPATPPSGRGFVSDLRSERGVALMQELTTRFEWLVTGGGAERLEPGEILWTPGPSGRLSRVAVKVARQTTESSGDADLPSHEKRSGPRLQATGQVALLPALVYDRAGDGTIGGTIIGIYPNEHDQSAPGPVRRNPESYAPPSSFYRIDEETAMMPLSAHATLARLNPEVLAGVADAPRFVAMSLDVVNLWEALVEVVAEDNRNPGALVVLRGYVSPNERQRLERMGINLALYSRFQYGDAIAVIYDVNKDNRMDDLDGDGAVDIRDAEVLAQWAERAFRKAGLAGGIGIAASFEGPNHIGTPFVHLDTRGWSVQWREE